MVSGTFRKQSNSNFLCLSGSQWRRGVRVSFIFQRGESVANLSYFCVYDKRDLIGNHSIT